MKWKANASVNNSRKGIGVCPTAFQDERACGLTVAGRLRTDRGRPTSLESEASTPESRLDLGSVHDASRTRIECIAPVHRAAIVPDNQIASAPLVVPGKRIGGSVRPDLVQ